MNQQATDWVEDADIIPKNQSWKTSDLFKKNFFISLSLLISFWYHSQGEFRFTTLGVKGKPRINFSLFQYGLGNVLHNSHHSLET